MSRLLAPSVHQFIGSASRPSSFAAAPFESATDVKGLDCSDTQMDIPAFDVSFDEDSGNAGPKGFSDFEEEKEPEAKRVSLASLINDIDLDTPEEETCPICLETTSAIVTIHDDHHVCQGCFQNYVDAKVSAGRVKEDELTCPYESCSAPVSIPQIKTHCDRATFGRFIKFESRVTLDGHVEGNLQTRLCPECEDISVIPADASTLTCPCGIQQCLPCKSRAHPGLTCTANQQQILKEQSQILASARSQGIKACPYCNSLVQLDSGCNFIYCFSEQCRGNKMFCFLCEKKLDEEHHYDHYKRTGPFGDSCNTLDGLE